MSIDFSADSKLALLTDLGHDAILLDIENWKIQRRFQGTNSKETIISSAILNHDEKKVIMVGWDGNLRVFEKESGKEQMVIAAHAKRGTSLARHPKQDKILSGGSDGTVVYWSLAEKKPIARWAFEGVVSSLAMSQDAKIACCTTKHGINIWDLP